MPPTQDLPSQETAPPQFYPTQFHPEFGYLVPRLPFRIKTRLVLTAIAFGAVAGAVAVFALVPGRDPAVVPSAHATPIAPGDRWHSAPASVSYLAPSLAVPVATALHQRLRAAAPSNERTAAPSDESAAGTQPPPAAAAQSKPKKKTVRQSKRRQIRPAEPDPRSAYAASVRRFAHPPREWSDRRGFWNW